MWSNLSRFCIRIKCNIGSSLYEFGIDDILSYGFTTHITHFKQLLSILLNSFYSRNIKFIIIRCLHMHNKNVIMC